MTYPKEVKYLINDSRNILVGSALRKEEFAKDFDFLTLYNLNYLLGIIPFKYKILRSGDKFVSLYVPNSKIYIDIWTSSMAQIPYDFVRRSLPKNKIIELNSVAKQKGLSLSSYGLYRKDGSKVKLRNPTPEKIIKYIHPSMDIPDYIYNF